jgi:protein AroM
VGQTEARWRAAGFDPLVVPLSPYQEENPAALAAAGAALRGGKAGLVVMDCIGFRRKTRDMLQRDLGVPVLVANLLVARVLAELCGL